VVTGQGNQLTFLLKSQQAYDQPLCALPFLVSGNTATMVPGSSCVTAGLGNFCTNGPPTIAIQTFLSGSASLQGGTMTLQSSDVFVEPQEPGPECGSIPPGLDQVNIESMTATLQLSPDGG